MNPSLIFRGMYNMDNYNNFITNKISIEFAHSFLTFILSLSTALLSIVSTLIVIIGLASRFQGDKQIVIEALIIAFLFSPFGLPKLGIYVIGLLELLNYTIKSI